MSLVRGERARRCRLGCARGGGCRHAWWWGANGRADGSWVSQRRVQRFLPVHGGVSGDAASRSRRSRLAVDPRRARLAHPRPADESVILDRDVDVAAASLEAGFPRRRRCLAADVLVVAARVGSTASVRCCPRSHRCARGAPRRRRSTVGLRDLARLALVPLRRFVVEEFGGGPRPAAVRRFGAAVPI